MPGRLVVSAQNGKDLVGSRAVQSLGQPVEQAGDSAPNLRWATEMRRESPSRASCTGSPSGPPATAGNLAKSWSSVCSQNRGTQRTPDSARWRAPRQRPRPPYRKHKGAQEQPDLLPRRHHSGSAGRQGRQCAADASLAGRCACCSASTCNSSGASAPSAARCAPLWPQGRESLARRRHVQQARLRGRNERMRGPLLAMSITRRIPWRRVSLT